MAREVQKVQDAIRYMVKAIEIWRLNYNRFHPHYRRLVEVSREHWDTTTTYQVQKIYAASPDKARELADQKLKELRAEAIQVQVLLARADNAEDQEVFRAWLGDIHEYEMLVLAALPGGIAC